MRIIVEGNQRDIDTLIRENRVRVSRGILSFSEAGTGDDSYSGENSEKSVAGATHKAKVQKTPKAKV